MTETEKEPLPLALDKCPIIDTIAEIRFISDVFPQARFGIIYEKLKHDYPQVEQLPLATVVPMSSLENDPNLKFKPHFRLIGKDGTFVQYGFDVLTISPQYPYPGWASFSALVEKIFAAILPTGILKGVTRLGLRYTNFFEQKDIFPGINLSIDFKNNPISYKNTWLRTELSKDGFNNNLQISNSSSWNPPKEENKTGSIIDIDTFKNYSDNLEFLKSYMDEISKAHDVEKRIFWELLKPETRKELGPKF